MGEYINGVTFIRNIILSCILGLLIPYILLTYGDPSSIVWGPYAQLMYVNGAIFVAVYSFYGLFRKETLVRFFIGCGYLVILIYFYTVGGTYMSLYLPSCGFGRACYTGTFFGYTITLGYVYLYTIILFLVLKFLNLLRNLVKPLDVDNKYKSAVLKKMKLRKDE